MEEDEKKILESINFHLGAISSQLAMSNALKAHELGIPVTYWDPTEEPWSVKKHRDSLDLSKGFKQGIPKEMRKIPS